jgi:signal transduction histidine kinase
VRPRPGSPAPAPGRRRRWHHRWRHSLRARLLTVFLALGLLMTLVLVGGARSGFDSGWREAGLPLVSDYLDRLAAEIGSPPDVARARALVQRLPIAVRIEGPSVHWDSRVDRGEAGRPAPWREGANDWLTRSTADGHRIHFGLATPGWRHGPRPALWVTLALLLVLVLAAYAYVRRLLRPLQDIGAGAERFGRGEFGTPIPLRRHDELGDLAQRVNTMARDIQGMLDAKRALLLAVSHELRSPLTRARLNVELLPDTAEGAPERAALLRDLNEMRALISDLLESERLASPHAALQREPVDVAALAREVVAELQARGLPLAEGVQIDAAPGLAPLPLDRARVRLLLRNLLDNALQHGAGATRAPCIRLWPVTAGALEIEVRDFGPGVPDAQLTQLAEPFYRPDSARTRAAGGVGLGLYLCRLVAQAHGGRFELRRAEPGLLARALLN